MSDALRWQTFPESVRASFNNVWEDIASLHAKCRLYTDFYEPKENCEVMALIAPSAFQVIEESLRNDIVMAFGRLIDSPGKGSRENLSLERCLLELKNHCAAEIGARWDRQFEAIRTHCTAIEQWRNKRVGHNDRKTALEYHANPLPSIALPYIHDALGLLSGLMNDVQSAFEDGATYFFPLEIGTGADLISFLKNALEASNQGRV